MADQVVEEAAAGASGFVIRIVREIVYSPLNLALATICAVLIYKLLFSNKKDPRPEPVTMQKLPPLKRRDMTLQELAKYDGTGPDGRVCVAVNGKIFDVTRGKRFYGPGGPYCAFAGRDASRGLATFSVEAAKDVYDDLSDLNSMQMESVREWEMQFTEKYDYVGRLLRPGEEPTDYSEEEEAGAEQQQHQHNS